MPRRRQEHGPRRVLTSSGRHCSDAGKASAGQSGGQEDLGLPLQLFSGGEGDRRPLRENGSA